MIILLFLYQERWVKKKVLSVHLGRLTFHSQLLDGQEIMQIIQACAIYLWVEFVVGSCCYRFDVLKWWEVCCLIRMQGCRKTQPGYLFNTNAVIPHKTSQQAHPRLVTTLDLRHSCINSASCQIST